MKIIINEAAWEFIAKYLGDLSKAVLTVGFASSFFEKLPLQLRIGFGILSFIFFTVSVIIMSKKGDK